MVANNRATILTIPALQAKAPCMPILANRGLDCDICRIPLLNGHHSAIRCTTCAKVVRKIGSSLTSSRGRDRKTYKVKTEDRLQISRIWISTDQCSYCNRYFSEALPKSIDHILPICLGGANSFSNFAICCLECNRAKSQLSLEKWLDLSQRVSSTYSSIFSLTG